MIVENGEPQKMQYVAFLRGINVGGKTLVPMAGLKKIFETLGFTEVRTLLISGNVIFQSRETDAATLDHKIAEAIEKAFKRRFDVITWPMADLEKLRIRNPFKGIKVTSETRLYVTFLSENPASCRVST